MPTRAEVYAAIDSEREYQDALGPDRTELTEKNTHTVGNFLVMMERYVRKAFDAWTDNPGFAKALEEIRKVAGIAVNCMERHGAPHRK